MLWRNKNKDTGGFALLFSVCRLLFVCGLFVVGTAVIGVTDAASQSAKCVKWERQLASLSSQPPKRKSARISTRYSRAIRSQKLQIRRVDDRLYYNGCSRRKGLFEKIFDRQCSNLRGQRRRMVRNLVNLESKLGSFSDGSDRGTKRLAKRIRNKMRRARCNVSVASLKTIAGATKTEKRQKTKRRGKKDEVGVEAQLKNVDTFKTMCVRSCDGYYFPVSFSTTAKSFKTDSNACSNLCPGADMRLYYHRTTGETVENMISVKNGSLYTDLQTAFAYRKNFNSQCGCNYKLLPRAAFKRAAKVEKKASMKAEKRIISRIALPAFRIDKGQDPETQLTMRGGLTMDQITEIEPESAAQPQTVARRVRVIGEEFFPSQ